LKKIIVITLAVITVITVACKKPEGEGATPTIHGMVHTRNYNSNFSTLLNQYPGADLDVYIIYGDDATYGNRVRSGPDGVFEFKYLRKGNYKIYVYSKDSLATVGPPYSQLNPNTNAPDMAVSKSVEISDKKGTVDAGTFTIYD
jgi:hypothetical protein